MMMFEKGGPVVWILLAYSVLGVSIVAAQYLQLALRKRAKLHLPIEQWPQGGELRIVEQLTQACDAKGHGAELRAAAAHHIYDEMRPMEAGVKTVSLLANTAPLLGLLGTITGMIKAFQVIESAGGKVDAMALAGGIWEAMLTTGIGLAVAIPLLILIHFWESALTRYHWQLQQAAALVLNDSEQAELWQQESITGAI